MWSGPGSDEPHQLGARCDGKERRPRLTEREGPPQPALPGSAPAAADAVTTLLCQQRLSVGTIPAFRAAAGGHIG